MMGVGGEGGGVSWALDRQHFLVMFWIGGSEVSINVSASPPSEGRGPSSQGLYRFLTRVRCSRSYKGGEDGRRKVGPP